MNRLRTLIVGSALSLTLLGGAAGAANAQGHVDGPHPFGQECVSEIARMEPGGVGPHVRGMHGDALEMSVGAHLQMMRAGNMNADHHGMDMCEMAPDS